MSLYDPFSNVQVSKIQNEDEAYEVYCSYAHNAGFSVRKDHSSYWSNSKRLKFKTYLCSKAGVMSEKKGMSQPKYRRTNTRCNCPAMIKFGIDEDGLWSIINFIEEHNHSLAKPTDQHLLRSSRVIGEEKASMLKSMTNAGIGATDAFRYLAEEVGGVENVGFSRKDAFNFLQKERRAKIEQGDANALVELFKCRVADDSFFAWDVEVDEQGRLLNFFWSDGIARLDYQCFGEVIIFDTSYRLNKYNLCCAPIVGVNHHWQNVLFGVAYLSDETIESFTWLFKTFLRIMDRKCPITIFTDQDQAMARAISCVFPDSRHRLCQWHIAKKLSSKVQCFNTNRDAKNLFYACLSKCDTVDEFQLTWETMLEVGGLHEHKWLADLYLIREKWSTAFNKNYFSLDILSTQRSESTNNVCHGISKPTSSLTDCFLGMEKLMTTWRRNEQDEDFKCSQTSIVPAISISPILKRAAAFYTKKIYMLFEEQYLFAVGGYGISQSALDSNIFVIEKLEKAHSRTWQVTFCDSDMSVTCSCKKFETMGILCSHCLKVLTHKQMTFIPEKYLLFRWSNRAKRDYYLGSGYAAAQDEQIRHGSTPSAIFRNYVSRFSYQISLRAQGNKEAEQMMVANLKKLSIDVDSVVSGKPQDMKKKSSKHNELGDPAKVRPKGVSNARVKGSWESKKKKKVVHTYAEQVPECSSMPEPEQQPMHSSMPNCLSQDFWDSQSSSQPSSGYTDMMMEIIRRSHQS